MFLFTVKEIFSITGRGLVLMPGISDDSDYNIIKTGKQIRLVRPDKSEIFTIITGIEWISIKGRYQESRPILIGKEITNKEDVPIGTEVWLVV